MQKDPWRSWRLGERQMSRKAAKFAKRKHLKDLEVLIMKESSLLGVLCALARDICHAKPQRSLRVKEFLGVLGVRPI